MLIGLTGKAGAGKSFAAKRLIEKHGFVLIKFADPLKNMLRALGLTDDHLEGHLKEVPCNILAGKTPRFAMQTLGTEWGRNIIDDQLWLNQFWRRATAPGMRNVVCDDVRFPNEADLIKQIGGHIVHITGSKNLSLHTHASESYTLPYHLVIENDFGEQFVKDIDNVGDILLAA